MLSHLVHWTVALALALFAHASIPGWTPAALAASVEHKKCTVKSHRHGKVAAAKPATRGSGSAQIRRTPEIQILSFGP
jgi:hypothetical protein